MRKLKHQTFLSNNVVSNEKVNSTFTKFRKFNNETQNVAKKWKKGTILIAGDSIISGLNEKKLSNSKHAVKVRCFPGATTTDMYNYLKPLLLKCPSSIILHVGTNDAINASSSVIVDRLLILKSFILDHLPECKVYISSPTPRFDEAKASYTIIKTNELLSTLDIDKVVNSNIEKSNLGSKGLHLNNYGTKKLALNFIKTIRKMA